MAKKTTRRRQRGEGGLYKRSDGLWVGTVDIGEVNGVRRRKTVTSKNYQTAFDKLVELKATIREHGSAPDASTTVGKWLTYWLDNVAAQRVRPRTMESYRTIVTRHLIPAIGKRRLDQLTPTHVRDMNRDLAKSGLAGAYVLKVHRTLAKALKDAQREGRVTRNVATLIDAPKRGGATVTAPLTVLEAKTLLGSLDGDPYGERWALALLQGTRQGESIGLEWDRWDRKHAMADISWQLQRLRFRHGCGGTCGYTRAGSCPQREPDIQAGFICRPVEGGLYLTKPKAHERVFPLAPQMTVLLERLWEKQGKPTTGLVWTDDGHPIDPKQDRLNWYAALEHAGVPAVNLHAARHTTGTLLLELGVDPQVIQSILGHSSAVSTKGYLHVRQPLQEAAMKALGGHLALDPVQDVVQDR